MDLINCPRRTPLYYWVFRCGTERDCADNADYTQATFQQILCDAIRQLRGRPGAWMEIWTGDRKRRIAKVTSRWATSTRLAKCGIITDTNNTPGARAPGDPFTVDVPGLSDIIKIKDWESKDLRRDRYQRFLTHKSAIPEALQWIPPLLTKLDNAQDMIFTGLALAIPLIRRLGPRMIPGIGILLTINDILNLFT